MPTYEWISSGGFGSTTPDITQNFQVARNVNADWTFIRAIVSYECTYEFLEDPTTILGTWLPTAIAVYWRFGAVKDSPRDIGASSGGDYSIYKGINWDDAVTPALIPDTYLHQFYAPRDGGVLDVQGERLLFGDDGSGNGLWVTCGLAMAGSPGPEYFPRTFMMTGTARILVKTG